MLQALSKDQSKFKNKIYILFSVFIMSIIAGVVLNSYRVSIYTENQQLANKYKSEKEWLQQIDYKELQSLSEEILKPVDKSNVDKVQQAQLGILRNHSLNIDSVRNTELKNSKVKHKFVKTTVKLTGTWENLITALNEFERKNLVVITDFKLNRTDVGLLEADFTYNIYYK